MNDAAKIVPVYQRRPPTIDRLTPTAQQLLIELSRGSHAVPKLVWAPLELLQARFAVSTALRRGFLLTITEEGRRAVKEQVAKVSEA